MLRNAEIQRTTSETDISLVLSIDGSGNYNIDTGIGFLNHMLELFAKHGRFDLSVVCHGDLEVDGHHSVEDIGICLGKAFAKASGERRGINRYADIILPMDEALIMAAVDFGGRAFLALDLDIPAERIGDFDSELLEEFMRAFAFNAGMTLHIKQLAGKNSHHIVEGVFKALARVLNRALEIDPEYIDDIPSTKGVL